MACIKEQYGRAGSSQKRIDHEASGDIDVGRALGEVGSIMAEGLQRLLGREEKLETLQDKTVSSLHVRCSIACWYASVLALTFTWHDLDHPTPLIGTGQDGG